MNNIKAIIFNSLIVISNTTLIPEAIYIKFKGLKQQLSLQTETELNSFYNQITPLFSYFKNRNIPYIVDEYYMHINALKSHQSDQFLHIHPSWVLINNSVIKQRNLKIGRTYHTNPLNTSSPQFKIEDIKTYKNNDNDVLAFSLIKISKGDNSTVDEYTHHLIEQPIMELFVGDPNRLKKILKTCNRIDRIILILKLIQQGARCDPYQLNIALKEIGHLVDLISSYPKSKKIIGQFNKLKIALIQPNPNVKPICEALIKIRPKMRTQALLYEFIQSLHRHRLFLTSPHSHTKENKLIFSHSYVPAFCRLNPAKTFLEKNIDGFFKEFTKKDNGREISLFMFHKNHHLFTRENDDISPFKFLTMPGEDTGQPIFAYNQKTQKHFLVSLNQLPKGQNTTVPIIIYPDILQWIIKITKDDYFALNYPELTQLCTPNNL